MTAHTLEEERRRCLEAGMNEHVAKPIEPERLFEVLLSCVKPNDAKPERTKSQIRPGTKKVNVVLPDSLPGLDLAQGIGRVGGNAGLYHDLLYSFYEDHRDTTSRLKEALQQGNIKTARQIIHTIKGLSGNLSATEVFEVAKKLELELEKGSINAVDGLTRRFESEITKVMMSIDSIRNPEVPEREEHPKTQIENKDTLILNVNALGVSLCEHNMKAEELFQSVKKELDGAGFAVALSELQNAVIDLEFEQALEILENLTESLGIQLEK